MRRLLFLLAIFFAALGEIAASEPLGTSESPGLSDDSALQWREAAVFDFPSDSPSRATSGETLGAIGDSLCLIGGWTAGGDSDEKTASRALSVFRTNRRGDASFRYEPDFLPAPTASAAFAAIPGGGILCGGENADGLSAAVVRLISTDGEGAFRCEPFAALPTPRADAAAVRLGSRLYLFGGRTQEGPSDETLSLDLAAAEPYWRVESSLPRPMERPSAVRQSDGYGDLVWLLDAGDLFLWRPGETRPIPDASPAQSPESPDAVKTAESPERSASLTACGAAAILLFAPNGETVRSFETVTRRFGGAGSLGKGLPPGRALALGGRIAWIPDGGDLSDARCVRLFEPIRSTRFGWVNYAVLIGYLALMLGLGFFFVRGNDSAKEFFHGGGRLPWWAAGISIFATMLSAITFLAIPAKAFATDWTMLFFNLGITLVAPIVIIFYLPVFRRSGSVSAYEYLEVRFNRATRLFASGLFTLFMVTRIAVVLYLPAIALSLVTGLDVFFCILAAGLVTLVYSTLGGMKAVVWGDVIQGVILVGGAILSLVWLFGQTDGGAAGVFSTAWNCGKLKTFDFSFDCARPVFWSVLLGGIVSALITYTSDQTVIQRYLTTPDEKRAARSIWLNAILVIPITLVFFAIGAALFVFYHAFPERLTPTLAPLDAIYPYYMVTRLPAGLSGLLIAAVFAAAMSTLSSNINSASAALCADFIRLARPNLSSRGEVVAGRAAGVVVGLLGIALAALLASSEIRSLWDQFNTFLGLLTGTLGALFFIGFFMKSVNGGGALTGVIVSVAVLFCVRARTDVSFLLYGVLEIVVCCAVAALTSRFFRRSTE